VKVTFRDLLCLFDRGVSGQIADLLKSGKQSRRRRNGMAGSKAASAYLVSRPGEGA
jgi:hypothetical protein